MLDRESRRYKLGCILFPERCALCGEVIQPGYRYCARCRAEAKRIGGETCPYCGVRQEDCVCKKHRRYYSDVSSLFYYEGVVRRYLPRFKRTEHDGAADVFAEELAIRWWYTHHTVDCITFVPSHKTALQERGFNPAELLATRLSQELNIPCIPLLRKLYETEPQKSLSRIERTGNLLGAFDVTDKLNGSIQKVLLVDDLFTTGSTVNECAKMLKIYGVKTVYVATVGNTLLKDE